MLFQKIHWNFYAQISWSSIYFVHTIQELDLIWFHLWFQVTLKWFFYDFTLVSTDFKLYCVNISGLNINRYGNGFWNRWKIIHNLLKMFWNIVINHHRINNHFKIIKTDVKKMYIGILFTNQLIPHAVKKQKTR